MYSVNNAPTFSTNPPPLINKIIMAQKKNHQQESAIDSNPIENDICSIESMDIEQSNLNSSTPIVLSKSSTVQE